MSVKSHREAFKVNDYYEHLISLRVKDPTAFLRLGGTTQAALQYYEIAKHDAENKKGTKGSKK